MRRLIGLGALCFAAVLLLAHFASADPATVSPTSFGLECATGSVGTYTDYDAGTSTVLCVDRHWRAQTYPPSVLTPGSYGDLSIDGGTFTIGTVAHALTLTPGSITAAPSATGTGFGIGAVTLTDNATLTSGTATIELFDAIAQPTLAAQNTGVNTTNAMTLAIAGAPAKGANDTATNTTALYIQSAAVGAQGTSYGLQVNAMTGAGANYAAAFSGGNVGIGTAAPGSTLTVNGSVAMTVTTPGASPYTAASDYYLAVTTGASNYTVNLPACVSGIVGRKYLVKKIDSGAGAVIVAPNGTDTIDGTNASAQFGGVTSSASSDSKGQFDQVEVTCRAAGTWDVTSQAISYSAALTSGTPSTWTVTVPTGSRCTCTNGTTQANPVKCAVSSTTLTATGPATVTDAVTANCMF